MSGQAGSHLPDIHISLPRCSGMFVLGIIFRPRHIRIRQPHRISPREGIFRRYPPQTMRPQHQPIGRGRISFLHLLYHPCQHFGGSRIFFGISLQGIQTAPFPPFNGQQTRHIIPGIDINHQPSCRLFHPFQDRLYIGFTVFIQIIIGCHINQYGTFTVFRLDFIGIMASAKDHNAIYQKEKTNFTKYLELHRALCFNRYHYFACKDTKKNDKALYLFRGIDRHRSHRLLASHR